MADYAVVLATCLARRAGERLSAADLAAVTHLPPAATAKVLKALAKAGVVEASRGAAGGYVLARPAAAVTVAEVAEAIDGPMDVTACTTADKDCGRADFCDTRPHWDRVHRAVRAALSGVTLADMIPSADMTSGAPLVRVSPHRLSAGAAQESA